MLLPNINKIRILLRVGGIVLMDHFRRESRRLALCRPHLRGLTSRDPAATAGGIGGGAEIGIGKAWEEFDAEQANV